MLKSSYCVSVSKKLIEFFPEFLFYIISILLVLGIFNIFFVIFLGVPLSIASSFYCICTILTVRKFICEFYLFICIFLSFFHVLLALAVLYYHFMFSFALFYLSLLQFRFFFFIFNLFLNTLRMYIENCIRYYLNVPTQQVDAQKIIFSILFQIGNFYSEQLLKSK